MKSLILSDPETALKTIAKNQEFQKGAGGESLINANGVGATAPLLSKDEASGVPYVQTTQGVTGQGQFGGGFTAGNGGMFSTRQGPGSFQGVTQPQPLAPGTRPGTFAPALAGAAPAEAGQPSQAAPGAAQAPNAPPGPRRTSTRSFARSLRRAILTRSGGSLLPR